MADQLLDRLRAEAPAPTGTPLDVDALWEAGRRRRRRGAATVASTGLTALLLAVLVVPGLVDLGRPGVSPILDQPGAGPAGDGFLTDEAIWVAPLGTNPYGAADLFGTAIETGWGSHYTAGGVDAADRIKTTIAVGEGTVEGSGRDGAGIYVHLFRAPEDRDRWHVVAVDSNLAPLTRQDGRAVVPLEPVPSGAVTVTVDRRTADGTDTVTVPVADLPGEVGEDPVSTGVHWMLLRYRDTDGRLLDARGATWTGPWADEIAADPGIEIGPDAAGEFGYPQLRFALDAVWTSPSVPDVDSAAWAFGLHAFGWHDTVVVEPGATDDSDGPRWLRIGDAFADDVEVDVLLSPDPVHPDAWHVLQVGDGEFELVRTELRFGPVPTEAVTAEVEYGSDRAHAEERVELADLRVGTIPLRDEPGSEEITAALVRFLDAEGRMIGAIGATFADEPGGGVGLPPDGPRDP